MDHRKQLHLIIIISTLAVCLFSSCQSIHKRGEKPSTSWSRSIPIGQSVTGSVDIAVEDSGEDIHMVWTYDKGDGPGFHYIQLDQRAQIAAENDLDFPGQLKFPRLVTTDRGAMHFFWANRIPGETPWTLWHTLLDHEGNLKGSPQMLSPDGENVGRFAVASDNQGGAVVVWDQDDQNELRFQHITQDGAKSNHPTNLGAVGTTPSVSVDADQIAHLSWLEDKDILYGQIDLSNPTIVDGTTVSNLNASGKLGFTGDTYDGPALGYADGWIYIFWSILSYSDVDVGTAAMEFIAFQADQPRDTNPEQLWMLAIEDQPMQPYSGNFAITEISPAVDFYQAVREYGKAFTHVSEDFDDWEDISGAVTKYVMNPVTMRGLSDELAAAMSVSVDYRLEPILQIGVGLFDDGEYLGYTLATKTLELSDFPALAIDQAGNMHVAWREGAQGKNVYYATTSPQAVAELDKITVEDAVIFLLEAGVESLASIAFMPFIGLFWMLPSILFIGAWVFIRGQPSIKMASFWVALISAGLIYYVFKMVTMPSLLTYVPFSAWLYLPEQYHIWVRVITPLLIVCLASFVAYRFHKRYYGSIYILLLAFVITDALFTLMIFGVNFFGAT